MRTSRGWLGVILLAGVGVTGFAQEPVKVPAEVMEARIVSRPAPVYPAIALAARVQGAVALHAIIGEDGTVKNLQVVSGPEMLRGAAIDAVRRWTFRPYVVDGEAKPVDTVVIVEFAVTVSPTPQDAGRTMGCLGGPLMWTATPSHEDHFENAVAE